MNERSSTFWKWGMYLLSMALFAVIVLILAEPFPIDWGGTFIGWKELWKSVWWFPLLFFAILIFDVSFYLYFKKLTLSGTRYISYKITSIESLDSSILAFLASYFVPLVSFSLNKPNHQLVLIILFVLIGTLYVRGDLYYQNPTLSLLGFKTYKVTCKYQEDIKERNVLCLSKLNIGDRIKYIPLSQDVWFAIKK